MPAAVAASSCTTSAVNFASCLSNVVINPILALIFAAGLLLFVWGIVQYMWNLSTQGKNEKSGKDHMLWGLIGMFIMVAAYTILKIVNNTIGANINL